MRLRSGTSVLGYLVVVMTVLSFARQGVAATVAGHADMGDFAFRSGSYMQEARNSLVDPNNFGAGGVVSEPITLLPDVTGPITLDKLEGIDIFITTILRYYTADEAEAVFDYVLLGGSLIFYGDVGIRYGAQGNSMAETFGIQFSEDDEEGGPYSGPAVTIGEPTHPTIDGPFGTSQFALNSTGSIVGQVDALTIATIATGPTAGRVFMVVQDASTGFPGTGRAVWLSDVNILANNTGLYPANETLFLNIVTYAGDLGPLTSTRPTTWSAIKSMFK